MATEHVHTLGYIPWTEMSTLKPWDNSICPAQKCVPVHIAKGYSLRIGSGGGSAGSGSLHVLTDPSHHGGWQT